MLKGNLPFFCFFFCGTPKLKWDKPDQTRSKNRVCSGPFSKISRETELVGRDMTNLELIFKVDFFRFKSKILRSPMAKKVALYCRVSTGNQSTGLEAQVRALRDYCTRNNVTDYILYEDENQSGVKQSRPALDRMMKDVREGLIEKVIVYSFSRYARSVTHLLRALEEFKKMDVPVIHMSWNAIL